MVNHDENRESQNADSENSQQPSESEDRTPPLQFGLSTLLWLMVAVGLIFGSLRWLQVSTVTMLIIMVLLAVSALIVVLLVAAIAKIEDQ